MTLAIIFIYQTLILSAEQGISYSSHVVNTGIRLFIIDSGMHMTPPPSPRHRSVTDSQALFWLTPCVFCGFSLRPAGRHKQTHSLRPKLNVVDIILTLSLFLDKVSRYIRPKSRCLCLLIYNIQYMSCTCT